MALVLLWSPWSRCDSLGCLAYVSHCSQGGEDDGEDGSGTSGGTSASDAPKFLVFAHHKTVMNRLAAALEGATGYAPVGYVRIDGSTDSEDRWADVSLLAGGALTGALTGRARALIVESH